MAPKADEYFNKAVDLVRCAPQFILHPTSSSICLLSRVLTVHRSRPWQCISTGCTTREAYDGVPQLHARGEGAVQNIYKRAKRKHARASTKHGPAHPVMSTTLTDEGRTM